MYLLDAIREASLVKKVLRLKKLEKKIPQLEIRLSKLSKRSLITSAESREEQYKSVSNELNVLESERERLNNYLRRVL